MARTVGMTVGAVVLLAIMPPTTSRTITALPQHQLTRNRAIVPHPFNIPYFLPHHYPTAQTHIDAQAVEWIERLQYAFFEACIAWAWELIWGLRGVWCWT